MCCRAEVTFFSIITSKFSSFAARAWKKNLTASSKDFWSKLSKWSKIDCVFHPLALNHDRREEREERTSSWIFFRKAISSCSVSMRLSRSRRASVAASTSCHKFGESVIETGSEIAGGGNEKKKKNNNSKNVQSLTALNAARLLSASSFWSISSWSLQEEVKRQLTQRI